MSGIKDGHWGGKVRSIALKMVNAPLKPLGFEVRKKTGEFALVSYDSYEQYREIQVRHNKRKLQVVWADEATLDLVAERVRQEFPNATDLKGICHGTRNGFEQSFLANALSCEVIGTEISDTASNFANTVQWDFHDTNDEWVSKFAFVYSNSLDQGWNPRQALTRWLDQLRPGGLLFIEHTRASHEPDAATRMDPFGVKTEYLPYVLADWFGHRISIEIMRSMKSNKNIEATLFVLKLAG